MSSAVNNVLVSTDGDDVVVVVEDTSVLLVDGLLEDGPPEEDEDSLDDSVVNIINKTMTSTSMQTTYNMVFNIYIVQKIIIKGNKYDTKYETIK